MEALRRVGRQAHGEGVGGRCSGLLGHGRVLMSVVSSFGRIAGGGGILIGVLDVGLCQGCAMLFSGRTNRGEFIALCIRMEHLAYGSIRSIGEDSIHKLSMRT